MIIFFFKTSVSIQFFKLTRFPEQSRAPFSGGVRVEVSGHTTSLLVNSQESSALQYDSKQQHRQTDTSPSSTHFEKSFSVKLSERLK